MTALVAAIAVSQGHNQLGVNRCVILGLDSLERELSPWKQLLPF
ncbi:MAG: hypothetical protein ACRC6M_15185 [Microcystaceae cyanobacterium]